MKSLFRALQLTLTQIRVVRPLFSCILVASLLPLLCVEPSASSEPSFVNYPGQRTTEESISIVRIEDDLMVRWLCPGFQRTTLLTLNGDQQWQTMDSTYALFSETQYSFIPPFSRKGFFRTSSEELQEFPLLRIITPAFFVSGLPTPIRVEAFRPDGSVDWESWQGEVELLTRADGPMFSPAKLDVHNGMASGLVTVASEGDLAIEASYGGAFVGKTLQVLTLPLAETTVAGQLSEPVTTWMPGDGIIHVIDNVTLPVGNTLRVYPDTIILLDPKKSIFVHGMVECLGTVEHPVLFAAADPQNPWGEIHHDHPSTKSIYRGAFFIRGGDSPGAGHTGKGPVIRVSDAEIEFDHCNFMDNFGKGLYASGGNLTFKHCLFARSAMGMEVVDVDIVVDRCYFTEMPMGGDIADNDPLYLHGHGNMSVTNTIFAVGGDDGIDTLSSTPLIENCIIHGFLDKGISVYYGAPRIKNCLILSNDYGISAKGDGTDVYVDRITVVKNRVSIQSRDKYNDPDAVIKYYITNCILWHHEQGVKTDYPLEDISITYSDVQGAEPFPGDGNITDDPLFLDPDANNFRLRDDSRCLGAGQNGVNMGCEYADLP